MKKFLRIIFIGLLFSSVMTACVHSGDDVKLTDEQLTMTADELRRELVCMKVRHSQILQRLAIAIVVLYLGGAFIWIVAIYRKKKCRDEYYFHIGQNIREIIDLKERENEKTSALVRELLAKEYSEIDRRCQEYYEKSSYQNKKDVSSEVLAFVERLSSKEQIVKLEERVNKYQMGIMSEFRRDLPTLKDADYMLFLYSIIGFSTMAIAVLLKTDKIDAIYNRKARLKAKVKQLDAPRRRRYLSYL